MADFKDGPSGTWADGRSVKVAWYRAGHLGMADDSFGPPETFTLDDGRDGHAWLLEALPFPGHDAFRYGCIRSALSAAWYHAYSGGWCGDVHFSEGRLYADNQQGESGIVVLTQEGSYGVFGSHDPDRPYDADRALKSAPPWAREPLGKLILEQRQTKYHADPTAIFWSDGDRLAGAEPFHVLYAYGFESFGDTVLDDEDWLEHVDDDFGGKLPHDLAHDIMGIAREFARTGEPVELQPDVMERLFPRDAPGRKPALRSLTDERDFIAMLAPPRAPAWRRLLNRFK